MSLQQEVDELRLDGCEEVSFRVICAEPLSKVFETGLAPEPKFERNAKTHFRPFKERLRDSACQMLPERDFGPATAVLVLWR